ncbi:MAG: hypothetical protein M3314_14170 [Actinomycetota bacterium]|nr:hypothetical protein [Actinomycetota bacterium]
MTSAAFPSPARREAATESVGAATVIADQLPGGAELASRAGEAFTSAFNVAALIAVVLMLVAAAVVFLTFNRRMEEVAARAAGEGAVEEGAVDAQVLDVTDLEVDELEVDELKDALEGEVAG